MNTDLQTVQCTMHNNPLMIGFFSTNTESRPDLLVHTNSHTVTYVYRNISILVDVKVYRYGTSTLAAESSGLR